MKGPLVILSGPSGSGKSTVIDALLRASDLAIQPVTDDETETHAMFQTDAARAYVETERRIDKAIHRTDKVREPQAA